MTRLRPAGPSLSRRRRLRARLDDLADALGPGALRRKAEAFQRRTGITRAGVVALVGAAVIWVMARVVAGTGMYLFAYGVVMLLVISYLIAPRNLKLEGSREGLFPRVHEGDRLAVEVKLTARRRVTTFLLEERVPERLGRPVRVPITSLPAGESVSHHYTVRATRRGVYQVGPLVAVSEDPLGLTRRETVVAEPFELLVHPRVELVGDRPQTRQFEDPPIRPPVSKPWPSGFEFHGMREFRPGDDLRRVVWRATARTGTLMVREAEQGITDKIVIILDTDRGSHSRDGEGLSESFETGVRAAASLAVAHLRDGYEVTTITNGGPLTRSLRGPAAQLVVLDALTRLDLSRDPLSGALRRVLATPRRDTHTILVTPRLGTVEASQLRLVLDTGASVLVVALLWDEETADTAGIAASLGCQVASVRPGDDLTTALHHDVGAGIRV